MFRVLVIDDDGPILEAIGDVLRGEGFLVREESAAELASEAAIEFAPDVVLIDLMMPNRDGTLVARDLRRHPTLADVPVILMSAHPRAAQFAREVGARACLRKPFSARRLIAAVTGDCPQEATSSGFTVG